MTKRRRSQAVPATAITPHSDMAKLGAKGGNATLKKKGPEWFRELVKRRRTHAGGRPKGSKNKAE